MQEREKDREFGVCVCVCMSVCMRDRKRVCEREIECVEWCMRVCVYKSV